MTWWWREILWNRAAFYIPSSATSLPLAETDCSTKWMPGLVFAVVEFTSHITSSLNEGKKHLFKESFSFAKLFFLIFKHLGISYVSL